MPEPKLFANPGTIHIDWPTEAKREGDKLLFPIKIQAPEGQDVRISILNLIGKSVFGQNIKAEDAARGQIYLNLAKVPLGIYFLSAEAGSAKSLTKLIIREEGAEIKPSKYEGAVQSQNALRFDGSILRVSCPSVAQLSTYNALGHPVGSMTVKGEKEFDVNKWDLPEGVYFVRMRPKEGPEYSAKITISR